MVRTYTDFAAGCALVAVTVAAEAEGLRLRAAEAFRAQQEKLAGALQAVGLSAATAAPTATLLVAVAEGAVVICRAEHHISPFEVVAAQLIEHVRALAAAA